MEKLTEDDTLKQQLKLLKGKMIDAKTLISFPGLKHLGRKEAERLAEKLREYAQVLFHCFQNWRKENEKEK